MTCVYCLVCDNPFEVFQPQPRKRPKIEKDENEVVIVEEDEDVKVLVNAATSKSSFQAHENHDGNKWSVFCSYFNVNPSDSVWSQVQSFYQDHGKLPCCSECQVQINYLIDCHLKLQSIKRTIQKTVATLSSVILRTSKNNNCIINNNKASRELRSLLKEKFQDVSRGKENSPVNRQIRLVRQKIASNYQPVVSLATLSNPLHPQEDSKSADHRHKNSHKSDHCNGIIKTNLVSPLDSHKNNVNGIKPSIIMNSVNIVQSSTNDKVSRAADNEVYNNSKPEEPRMVTRSQEREAEVTFVPSASHRTNNLLELAMETEKNKNTVSSKDLTYCCKKCSQIFLSPVDLVQHRRNTGCNETVHSFLDNPNKWHSVVDEDTGEKNWFYDSVWPVSMTIGEDHVSRFKCLTCKVETRGSRGQMADHIFLIHIQPNSFICSEPGCGRACTSEYHLELHKSTAHSDKQYECELCSEKFKLESTLAFHMQLAHKPKEQEVIEIPPSLPPPPQQQKQQQKTRLPTASHLRLSEKTKKARDQEIPQSLQQQTIPVTWPYTRAISTENNQAASSSSSSSNSNIDTTLSNGSATTFVSPSFISAHIAKWDKGPGQTSLNLSDEAVDVNITEVEVDIKIKNESESQDDGAEIELPALKDPFENFYNEAMEEEDALGSGTIFEQECDPSLVKQEGIFQYDRWSYANIPTGNQNDLALGCMECGEILDSHELMLTHIKSEHAENSYMDEEYN